MRRSLAVALPLGALLVLAVAQLVLPDIAARRLRDRLSRSGTVISVHVDAFPAIELLWHQADRVVVRLDRYRARPGRLASLLAESGEVDSVLVTARELDSGLLTLRDARLVKQGSALTGSATIAEPDLRAAIPALQQVVPVASADGTLVLRGTVRLLGQDLSADAVVSARDGAVVVAPDVPFGALASLTVFANPHLYVHGLSAMTVAGGFRMIAVASLR